MGPGSSRRPAPRRAGPPASDRGRQDRPPDSAQGGGRVGRSRLGLGAGADAGVRDRTLRQSHGEVRPGQTGPALGLGIPRAPGPPLVPQPVSIMAHEDRVEEGRSRSATHSPSSSARWITAVPASGPRPRTSGPTCTARRPGSEAGLGPTSGRCSARPRRMTATNLPQRRRPADHRPVPGPPGDRALGPPPRGPQPLPQRLGGPGKLARGLKLVPNAKGLVPDGAASQSTM